MQISAHFRFSKSGLIIKKNRLYVPKYNEVKLLILDELHKKPYFGYLGYHKLITMLRNKFYWPNMKGESVEYLARCLECQQVKVEHQHYTKLAPRYYGSFETCILSICTPSHGKST